MLTKDKYFAIMNSVIFENSAAVPARLTSLACEAGGQGSLIEYSKRVCSTHTYYRVKKILNFT